MTALESVPVLAVWYRDHVRKLLEEHAAERVGDLDEDLSRVQRMVSVGAGDLPICFLGNAGVGKSTLLNAMVGGRVPILPAGGIGPLTAQATFVRFAADPYFKATYLSGRVVSNMLFVLERDWDTQLRARGEAVAAGGQDIQDLLGEEDRVEADVNVDGAGAERPVDAYARQATLLIAADGGASTRDERERTLARVLETLRVYPLAATEYRKILQDDDEDRAKLRSLADSRIPSFVDALGALATDRKEQWNDRLEKALGTFGTRAHSAVQLVLGRWNQEERAEEDAARVRTELEALVVPLRKEFLVRHGAFRNFLRETVPAQIAARVAEAAGDARKDLGRHVGKYVDVPWQTLRAAIRRGGTFVGAKKVDLPNELTLLFEEPVAIVWSKRILTDLRKETIGMGNDYVRLVGEIVSWAKRERTRVKADVVEALHQELQAAVKDLADVGKDAIDDLKARVKTQLYEKVEDRVRTRCQKFVNEGKDQGIGVKFRMHEFLVDLSDVVVEAASPIALKVLTENYHRVEQEIEAALLKHRNPVDSAVNEIVAHNETRIARGDARTRKKILEQGARVLAAMPPLPAGGQS